VMRLDQFIVHSGAIRQRRSSAALPMATMTLSGSLRTHRRPCSELPRSLSMTGGLGGVFGPDPDCRGFSQATRLTLPGRSQVGLSSRKAAVRLTLFCCITFSSRRLDGSPTPRRKHSSFWRPGRCLSAEFAGASVNSDTTITRSASRCASPCKAPGNIAGRRHGGLLMHAQLVGPSSDAGRWCGISGPWEIFNGGLLNMCVYMAAHPRRAIQLRDSELPVTRKTALTAEADPSRTFM